MSLVSWVLVIGACNAEAQARPAAECRRVSLTPAPSWASSGVWDPEGAELVLVDIAGARLLRYSKNGSFIGAIARPGLGSLEFNHPAHLARTKSGYLLSDGPQHLVWLDRQLESVKGLDLRGDPVGPLAVLDKVALGDELVVLGLRYAKDRTAGFLRLQMDPARVVETVESIDPSSAAWDLYALNRPVLAEAGGVAYALRYDHSPFIFQASARRRRLTAFPAGFDQLPRLPEQRGPGAAAIRYRALERSTLASQLHGRGRYLFLLLRSPGPLETTTWQLSQIDPEPDRVLRTVTLPTNANHLFLVPGPNHWAVVEKGPVFGVGKQEIATMLLIPTDWIEDPRSTILGDSTRALCRTGDL